MTRRLVGCLLVLLAAAASGCSMSVGVNASEEPAAGATVYLVPVGQVAPASLQAAAAELSTFDVRPVTLAPVEIDERVHDSRRDQLVSEKVAARVRSEALARKVTPTGTIFALTDYDIYTDALSHQAYAYGHRAPSGDVAVISTARLDPSRYIDGQPDPALFERRLRTYVARNATFLVLHRASPDNRDCITQSELYNLAQLDALSTNRC